MSTSLALAESTSARLVTVIDVLPLDTLADETRAADLLRVIATVIADAETERKARKAPHLAAGREVDELFKAPLEKLRALDGKLRGRLAEKAREREEARRAAVLAATTAPNAQEANAALAAVPEDVRHQGVSERHTWAVESVDLRAVPVEYLAIDMPRVRAEIAEATRAGRAPAVQGIVFRREASVVVRRIT